MEYVSEIPHENIVRLRLILSTLIGFLFVYALLLPDNWTDIFGYWAWPIQTAAQNVPAICKIVASSSTPNYVAGVLGLSMYIPPIFTICTIWYGLFDRTELGKVRLIIGKRDWFIDPLSGNSEYRNYYLLRSYFLFPFLLYFCFELPLTDTEGIRHLLEDGPISITGRMWAFFSSGIIFFISWMSANFAIMLIGCWAEITGKRRTPWD